MTDQHPLTDEMCENIAPMAQWADDVGDIVFNHRNMRAAADWQLEQVIEWLKSNTTDYMATSLLGSISVGAGCYFLTDSFLDDLKKAMRPTTTTTETP